MYTSYNVGFVSPLVYNMHTTYYVFSGGRLGWAALSDQIGRRKTFFLFTAASVPLYLYLPTCIDSVLATGNTTSLYVYCAAATAAISIMGGTYAIIPAYEADLFGIKHVGTIHGKMLLYPSLSAIVGRVAVYLLLVFLILLQRGFSLIL